MRHDSDVQLAPKAASPDRFALAPPIPGPTTKALRVPFGYRDGRFWFPNKVPAGLACECRCPECGSALVAKARDSHTRRPHFAHYRSSECKGGFETALHRMAKQLLVDHLVVAVPSWDGENEMPNPPMLRDNSGTEIAGRRVEHPGRVATLRWARAEERLGDYVPDVMAEDEFGRLLIEIKVTHAVDSAKRRRIQSEGTRLVEIDLSALREDDCADEDVLIRAVLSDPKNRRWLSFPEATEDWRQSLRELQDLIRTRNRELLDKEKLRAETMERALASSRAEAVRAAESKSCYRDKLREKYRASLEKLPELISVAARKSRLSEMQARDSDLIETLVASIPEARIQSAVQDFHPDAWIYRIHPAVWQAEVYFEFVAKREAGYRSSQRQVAQWVRQEFGLEPDLYDLFRAQYEARTGARKCGYRKFRISAWYFTEEENRQIPNFYRPINAFVEKLVYLRLIAPVGSLPGEFEVLPATHFQR
jgi:hypothetical protein